VLTNTLPAENTGYIRLMQ